MERISYRMDGKRVLQVLHHCSDPAHEGWVEVGRGLVYVHPSSGRTSAFSDSVDVTAYARRGWTPATLAQVRHAFVSGATSDGVTTKEDATKAFDALVEGKQSKAADAAQG